LTIAPGGSRPLRCQARVVRRNLGSKTEMLGAAFSSPLRANMYSTSSSELA
jgi:hypothetical protein